MRAIEIGYIAINAVYAGDRARLLIDLAPLPGGRVGQLLLSYYGYVCFFTFPSLSLPSADLFSFLFFSIDPILFL